MNWFMLANELIQHSRNTSIATTVNRKSTTTSLNLYLITLLLSLGIKHNKQALQKGSLGSYSLPIWGAKCYKQMKFKQKLANIFLMTYPPPPPPPPPFQTYSMSLIRRPYMKHIFKAVISHHLGFLHNPPPIPNIH